MYETIEELYYVYLERAKADTYPAETARDMAVLDGAAPDLVDACHCLIRNARFTGFREGLALGLRLSRELPL